MPAKVSTHACHTLHTALTDHFPTQWKVLLPLFFREQSSSPFLGYTAPQLGHPLPTPPSRALGPGLRGPHSQPACRGCAEGNLNPVSCNWG